MVWLKICITFANIYANQHFNYLNKINNKWFNDEVIAQEMRKTNDSG